MEFTPINTQEDFDAAIKDRLTRERKKMAEKYGDYEELKAQAEAAKDAQAQMEELRRKADEAEGALSRMTQERETEQLRQKISEETGVPARLISGADEEAMRASAKDLAEWAKPKSGVSTSRPGDFADGAKPKKATRDQFAESLESVLNH